MPNLFTRDELDHLKYRLMNYKGMSESEAEAEIAHLIEFSKQARKTASKQKKLAKKAKIAKFEHPK